LGQRELEKDGVSELRLGQNQGVVINTNPCSVLYTGFSNYAPALMSSFGGEPGSGLLKSML
jgi:hypothetical protein